MNKLLKTNTTTQNSSKTIATQWYEERSRQARTSFNIAIALATATVIFGITAAVSVCTKNVPIATATAVVGLTSGVASKRLFQIYDNTNKKLDDVAKELLDDQ
ncbi:TRADD-N-associated membrane domain-containing protein [Iningainema tapete]|uniref:Cyanobacterial TRADD-N associated 2 transmembrane domain-containing protein n=1 Tax=Iningainema tapete BLCC-T55 TaxID=2748662 RepID=A0A8J7CAH5_9CYAN|nr:hypothetical protein [Iningainema tapete]MBD2777136.1 hypothetical protein [Iningainema tapete BLCC-T55]